METSGTLGSSNKNPRTSHTSLNSIKIFTNTQPTDRLHYQSSNKLNFPGTEKHAKSEIREFQQDEVVKSSQLLKSSPINESFMNKEKNAPIKMSEISLSKQHKHSEESTNPNILKKPAAMSQEEVYEKLIYLISGSLSSSSFHNSTNLKETILIVKNTKISANLLCSKCNEIKVSLKLPCSHLTCKTCYINSLNSFLLLKSSSSLKICSCSICGDTGGLSFYSSVLPESSKDFSEMSIQKTCSWCKRRLNLCKDFPSDLQCKHLCNVCYMNDVYLNSKKCISCRALYTNTHLTKKRTATCLNCNKNGRFIKHCFRTIHKDCVFCLDCWVEALRSNKCLACEEDLTKTEVQILLNFANIKCPLCSNIKHISEINTCKKCSFIVCDSCNTENYKCGC